MNQKVRVALATLAAGALSCSLIAPAFADAEVAKNTIDVNGGTYKGRIAGRDRFATAVDASQSLILASNVKRDTIVLANYESWSDVLAATPLADNLNSTVLYTYTDTLGATTKAELKRLRNLSDNKVTRVLIVGGVGVVSAKVEAELAELGFVNNQTTPAANSFQYGIDRIGGTDRFETGLLLASEAVNGYDGSATLINARKEISRIKHLEAKYQEAVAAWETARAKTDAAQSVVLEKSAAVAAAQEALNDALAGIVSPVPMPDQWKLDKAATDVVNARDKVNNIQTVQGFVNGLLAEYATAKGTDFQKDKWTDVVAYFGSKSFTVTLAGDKVAAGGDVYTGTLAQLSDNTGSKPLPFLAPAAASKGTVTIVKEVELNLATQLTAAQSVADTANRELAVLMAQAQASQDAADQNSAQMKKVVAAQQALAKADAELLAAQTAHTAAKEAEAKARAEVVERADYRPVGDALQNAQNEYNKALEAVLKNGKRYPAFLATGLDFADALAAGPAAADERGVVLLTNGATVPASTQRYLNAGPNKVAIGGPAAIAVPTASVKYVGKDRYETATKLAAAYFEVDTYVGLASGAVAADAVVAGAVMANVDSTLVLTKPTTLPLVTKQFLSYDAKKAELVIFGGSGAISNEVADQAERAVSGK